MRSSRKATPAPAETSDVRLEELSRDIKSLLSLPDELKSIRDVLRSLESTVNQIEFFGAKKGESDAVKTELRLIRSDLAALEKKLSPAAV